MAEFKTRGYSVTSTLKFIDATYDVPTRQRILDQCSPEVKSTSGKYKDIEWYPAAHFSELLRGIAATRGGSDEGAREELVRAGQFIANVAANTFLKLFMKVLTPPLFAKKIPSLWDRDNQGGRMETDLSKADEGRIVFFLQDVGGYDYIAPVAVGWVAFAMQAMGKTVLERTLTGWSLAQPGPAQARIDLSWKK
jgi:hypothetical protein